MSLVQTTGKIEPTDFSSKAATGFTSDTYNSGSNYSGTISFSASEWALNSHIHYYDTQTKDTIAWDSYQNKIILIKWDGSYLRTPYYEYGVWYAVALHNESYKQVRFKTVCPYSSYYMLVADYQIKEYYRGADQGYDWQVTKANVRTMYYNTGTNQSYWKWRTTILSNTALYPAEITFLSPNIFPIFS